MRRLLSLKSFAALVLVAVAFGLVLGVAYSVKSDSQSSSAGASEGLGTEILYLGPLGDAPSSSVDASRFEALGATAVSSFADLRSATTDGAKAILIHRDHIGTLSASDIDWARASFRDGVILGGINISVEELSEAFGVRLDLVARYVSQNSDWFYSRGCEQGNSPPDDVTVILSFGQPQQLPGGEYGTLLYDNSTYASVDETRIKAQQYALGYFQCTVLSPQKDLKLVVGTSNLVLMTGAVEYGHGQAWAEMVNELNASISQLGMTSRVTARGGIDIEPDWSTVAEAVDWVNGYDSVNAWSYFNFGTADGCPSSGSQGCNNGWTRGDVWYVSWGASPAFPLPELYQRSGAFAAQWQGISRDFPGMDFSASLTQETACLERPEDLVCLGGGDNPAVQGWRQLWILLNGDLATQDPVEGSTDISWENE